jgi:phage minor structural protein
VSTSFTTISDVPTIFSYRCVRKSLAEAVNDVIERWGGHLVRNNWQIEVRQNAGQDRGVNLVYGKNIVNITSSEDWPDVCTKLMPVGKDGLLLDETWLSIDEQLYDIPYTKAQSFEQNEINQKDYSDGEGNSDEAAYKELDKYADITSNTADSVGKLDKEMGALKNELDAGRLFKRHFRRWRYNFCKTSKMQN